ncbi:hypothetical protein C0Q70_05564 [Pomacea canaliculata]|uniref:PIH1D1/2/3 CS-like domain-containing protein n=1 Tax=Pomacea canaliculata TaxID=400727 RepID=A0A2T7PLI7_POMCA|nr:hypothetical protein C0Q70_05564 [Pomacea canaliculata]
MQDDKFKSTDLKWSFQHAIFSLLQIFCKTEEPESDSEDDLKPEGTMGSLAPGDIGPKAKPQNKASGSKKNSSKDIWDAEEVVEGSEYDCLHDPRPQPGYEIIYKQAVTSEDMFLQMGNKTPATASCEDMIVKIHLPETKMSDVELDVKEKFLDLRTPK